jgi:hypothetical protein
MLCRALGEGDTFPLCFSELLPELSAAHQGNDHVHLRTLLELGEIGTQPSHCLPMHMACVFGLLLEIALYLLAFLFSFWMVRSMSVVRRFALFCQREQCTKLHIT